MPRIPGVAILNAPAIAASIPTPSPWITAVTQNGTTSAGSAIITALTATANLNVGQPVTGTGVPAGSVITSIDSATQIHISLPATAAGTVSLSFLLWSPFNTGSFAGGFQGYSIPNPVNDVPGCLFEIPNLQTMAAGSTYVLPPGSGFIVLTSGTTAMQLQAFQGTSSPGWVTLGSGTASVTSLLPFISVNCPTTAGTLTVYQLR